MPLRTRFASLSVRAAALSLLTVSLGLLTGCSGFGPSAPGVPIQTAIGSLKGQVYGGRAPVTGAHMFLFAAGTGGYGGKGIAASTTNASTSLLTSITTGSYPTTLDNTAGDATYGDYYVTTDSNGGFSLDGDYTCISGTQIYIYVLGGNPGLSAGFYNPQIGQLAILGTCPPSGTLAGSLPGYIYMDEVSTVAAAYVMAPYASDALHVSSSNTTLGTKGIQNAFATAANLYNLYSDANSAQTGNSGALATTPGGNGTVPQAELNTLANILLQCINSNNSSTASTTVCNTLRAYATNDGSTTATIEPAGYSGTFPTDEPTDTATAILNIAQHPAVEVLNLCNQQGSGAALIYKPNLICTASTSTTAAVPNDWTVQISYTGGGLFGGGYYSAHGVGVDGSGNVWVTNGGNKSVSEFNYLGAAVTPAVTPYSFTVTTTTVVTAGSTLKYTGTTGVAASALVGLQVTISGYSNPALNGTFTCTANATTSVTLANAAGVATTGLTGKAAPAGYIVTGSGGYAAGTDPEAVAFDLSGNAWIVNEGTNNLTVLSSAGALLHTYTASSLLNEPLDLQFDGSGNGWVANLANADLVKVSSTAGTGAKTATTDLPEPYSLALEGGLAGDVWAANIAKTGTTYAAAEYTNALAVAGAHGLTNPAYTVAIDSAGNAWYGGTVDSLTKVTQAFASGGAYTPAVGNYYASTATLNSDAIDGAGNLWADDNVNGTLYEVATGTQTSAAAGTILSGTHGFVVPGNPTCTASCTISIQPDSLAVDGSGNVWYDANGMLYEIVGAATPVVTPQITAVANSTLGQTP